MMAILKGWSLQCSVMFSVQMPEGICNERESDSAGAEDFAGEGEEGAGFVVPLDVAGHPKCTTSGHLKVHHFLDWKTGSD
jgi:L-fucose isomerase-like protein